jgi:hypothetical protein
MKKSFQAFDGIGALEDRDPEPVSKYFDETLVLLQAGETFSPKPVSESFRSQSIQFARPPPVSSDENARGS